MTGQTLLDTMELLNQELQLQSGEADVTRGLLALNIAQDHFESLAAVRPNMFGGGYGTVNTTAGVETSAYPTGLLRVDALYYLDPTTSMPSWKLEPRYVAGQHRPSGGWLRSLGSSNSTGKPVAYWTNGTNIWWDPLPDGTNTVRYYGMVARGDITASGTFEYPDAVRLPLASFAVSLMKVGVDDDPSALGSLAASLFIGVIDELSHYHRDGAVPLVYTQDHR